MDKRYHFEIPYTERTGQELQQLADQDLNGAKFTFRGIGDMHYVDHFVFAQLDGETRKLEKLVIQLNGPLAENDLAQLKARFPDGKYVIGRSIDPIDDAVSTLARMHPL